MFKLKITAPQETRPGMFVGVRFQAGNRIFTLTSYDSEVGLYRRNDGEGTPESPMFGYSNVEVITNFKSHWQIVP